jgi:hypothetical protein
MINLTNKLFGFDWVIINFAGIDITRRIKKFPNGREYIKIYNHTYFVRGNFVYSETDVYQKQGKPIVHLTRKPENNE